MRFSDKLKNFLVDVKSFLRSYSYIASPCLAIVVLLIFNIFNITDLDYNSDFINNVVNISGILSGFLFTAYGIFISLPDNNFIDAMKKTGHFNVIYRVLLFGIVSLIVSMLLGLFNIFNKLMVFIFIIGISEVILGVYYFYNVTKYSSSSK